MPVIAGMVLLLFICATSCEYETARNNTTNNGCIHNPEQPVPASPVLTIAQLPDTAYTGSICGLFPLNIKNRWIYRDSFFNAAGTFTETKMDTLYVAAVKPAITSQSLWWHLKSARFKGAMPLMYTTDSVLYFANSAWAPATETWMRLHNTDSLMQTYLYTDVPYSNITRKLAQPVQTPAGLFGNCYRFDKRFLFTINSYEITVQPGIGIIKLNMYAGLPGSVVRERSVLVSYLVY